MTENEDVKLEKFIEGEIQVLSPILVKSNKLAERAAGVSITDKDTFGDAKKLKRELVTHRNEVKDMRLTFTRKLDNLKDQFIKKQDEVLEPSIAAELAIKEKLLNWETEQQRLKEAEAKRIADIIGRLGMPEADRKTITQEGVDRLAAMYKGEVSLVNPRDRAKVAVKVQIDATKAAIAELGEYVTDRDKLLQEAANLEAKRKLLESDKVKFEEQKAAPEQLPGQMDIDETIAVMDEKPGNLVGVYRHKGTVQAIEITNYNVPAVINYSLGTVGWQQESDTLVDSAGNFGVSGDYLIRDNNEFCIIDKESFEKTYERVEL